MECGKGSIQTRGTCWFHTILNGFLLSEDGKKILFAKMKEFYDGLTEQEREFFNDGIDAPCPLKNNVKPLFFYKFLEQYLCFFGKKYVISKSKLSPKLLENINLVGNVAKEHKGSKGAFPFQEVFPILDKLGFANEYNIVLPTYTMHAEKTKKWRVQKKIDNPKFLVYAKNEIIKIPNRRIMCASITVMAKHVENNKSLDKSHAIAGIICNNKGYLIDPNRLEFIPCKWWDKNKLIEILPTISKRYPWIFTQSHYDYTIYSNPRYVDSIHPYCRRVQRSPFVPVKPVVKPTKPVVRPVSPTSPNHGVNRLGRKILKGVRGGFYVIGSSGKKIYGITRKQTSPIARPTSPNYGVNRLGRKIHKGVRGGLYIIGPSGKKIYKFKPSMG